MIREHSNIAKFKNFTGCATRNGTKPKKIYEFNESDLPHLCQNCRIRIRTAQSISLLEEVMLTKLEDIEKRFTSLQDKYASLQSEHERAIAENNEFRLICFSDKESESPESSHLFSIDGWDRDTVINYMNFLQKRFEFFATNLLKVNSKIEVSTRAKEISQATKVKAEARVRSEELDKRRRTMYKKEAEMVASLLKSSHVKAIATSQNISLEDSVKLYCKNMGILIPEDFWK